MWTLLRAGITGLFSHRALVTTVWHLKRHFLGRQGHKGAKLVPVRDPDARSLCLHKRREARNTMPRVKRALYRHGGSWKRKGGHGPDLGGR